MVSVRVHALEEKVAQLNQSATNFASPQLDPMAPTLPPAPLLLCPPEMQMLTPVSLAPESESPQMFSLPAALQDVTNVAAMKLLCYERLAYYSYSRVLIAEKPGCQISWKAIFLLRES